MSNLPHKISIDRKRYKVDDQIRERESDALSNYDLDKLLNGKAKILVYDDLANYSSIDDLLYPEKNTIILYQNTANEGHWVALLDRGNAIEFFDSYGGKPDTQLKGLKHNKLPYLAQLIENTDKIIYYNPYQLQSTDDGVSTCGRWVVLRVLLKDLPLTEFVKIFAGYNRDPDYIATLLTEYKK